MMISCSTQPLLSLEAKKDLASTGKLRAGMNLGNTLFTQKNNTGELQGVSVDLMQELAKRLDVPLEMVIYDEPGQVLSLIHI